MEEYVFRPHVFERRVRAPETGVGHPRQGALLGAETRDEHVLLQNNREIQIKFLFMFKIKLWGKFS